jgi:predicted MPP superfamily phosphohydrolase
MDHAPYCLEEAYKNKIDVQFSGHTHYGQIWPLNYFTKAVYDIAWGYKKIDSTHFFVSCGVQDAILPGRQDLSIPVRIGSVSEIMEIDIAFK